MNLKKIMNDAYLLCFWGGKLGCPMPRPDQFDATHTHFKGNQRL